MLDVKCPTFDAHFLVSARPEIGENEISRHQKIKVPVTATQT
jgi:hypothetical protein